jgi:GNAT superfamily N-acetyltransferase
MYGIRGLPGRPAYPLVEPTYPYQLEMTRRSSFGLVEVPRLPEGYELRQFRRGDEGAYDDLFHLAFADEGRFQETLDRTLPGGFFVVEHITSHHLVASCVALRGSSSPRHHAGQLGWLVTDPSHTRKGLGTIVAAAVTNRLAAGYERPFLGTEDFRTPAIAIYLKLGWRPHVYHDDMGPRWQRIFASLGREFVAS